MNKHQKALENIRKAIQDQDAEFRREEGLEPRQPKPQPKIPSLKPEPKAPKEESDGRFAANRFLETSIGQEPEHESAAQPEPQTQPQTQDTAPKIVEVIPQKDSRHSWLYNEVAKAVQNASGDNPNTKVVAVFVPVVQSGHEFEDLPVHETVELPPVNEEDFKIEDEIDIQDDPASTEPETPESQDSQEPEEPQHFFLNESKPVRLKKDDLPVPEPEPEQPEEPLISEQEPLDTEETVATKQEPVTTEQEPQVSEELLATEQQPVISEEPVTTEQEPQVPEEPLATEQQPQESEEPAAIEQEPLETEETALSEQEPVISEEPVTIEQEPQVPEEPLAAEQQPQESEEPANTESEHIEPEEPEISTDETSESEAQDLPEELSSEPEQAEHLDELLPESIDLPDPELAEAFNTMEEILDEHISASNEELPDLEFPDELDDDEIVDDINEAGENSKAI